MFLLLNGAFGIGKTTAARALAARRGAAIYDPERVGYVLRRLPPWVLGLPRRPDDYQELALWRRLVAGGAVRAHRGRELLIVPMAFSNLTYLRELEGALNRAAPVVTACLVAPLEVVAGRLAARAAAEDAAPSPWALRRAAECVAAHVDPAFGAAIDAAGPTEEIVAALDALVGPRLASAVA